MKTLQAATIQLEIIDFEEWFLLKVAVEKDGLNWIENFHLRSIREKRKDIYKTTFVK